MSSLPDDVRSTLVQVLGAYVGRAPAQDLPRNLRRLKGFRPKALSRHGDELLGLLEDDIQRKLILQALDDGVLRPSKRAEQVMRVALGRDEGWEEELAGMSATSAPAPEPGPDLEADLARERRRVKEAREEARWAKAAARAEVEAHLKRTEELEREVLELESQLEQARTLLAVAHSETAANLADMQHQARRLLRDAAKAKAEREEAKSETKALRRELTSQARKQAAAEQARPRPPSRQPESLAELPPPEARVPLPVPKGLFAEAADTLDVWLGAPRVSLLIDGYNVSKTEAGFGTLSLEHQRTRLIDEIDRLARTRSLPATIVFDGAVIGPGTSRRTRRTVEVVYSRPPESADDHLVALLESLPKHPVVVVTNDKELQERCVERGATIARAEQLLSLIR